MAVTNGERLMKLETQMVGIKEDINEIKDMLSEHIRIEEERYANLDNKYSAKWVENTVLAIAVTVVGAIVLALIKLL